MKQRFACNSELYVFLVFIQTPFRESCEVHVFHLPAPFKKQKIRLSSFLSKHDRLMCSNKFGQDLWHVFLLVNLCISSKLILFVRTVFALPLCHSMYFFSFQFRSRQQNMIASDFVSCILHGIWKTTTDVQHLTGIVLFFKQSDPIVCWYFFKRRYPLL